MYNLFKHLVEFSAVVRRELCYLRNLIHSQHAVQLHITSWVDTPSDPPHVRLSEVVAVAGSGPETR